MARIWSLQVRSCLLSVKDGHTTEAKLLTFICVVLLSFVGKPAQKYAPVQLLIHDHILYDAGLVRFKVARTAAHTAMVAEGQREG